MRIWNELKNEIIKNNIIILLTVTKELKKKTIN